LNAAERFKCSSNRAGAKSRLLAHAGSAQETADVRDQEGMMNTDAGQAEQSNRRFRFNWLRIMRWTGIGLVAALLAIQLIPYGRDHSNPPVTQAVQWDNPRTAELVERACYDCHSNETEWPWYSNIAPVSWLVQKDVDEGRDALNFSEWDKPQEEAHESAETVQEGEMPLWYYTITHRDAALSDQEKQELVDGFIATLGSEDDD
jgi:mono/diheme cytochrome c family protein